ncbi:hypothetical protein [Psychroflexus sp. ALD_RP9]|uniref:hypothetical protein n=1 Tax=Psychroflexus sp. ALD_RP9 TaxID=2777186 RepID=UPI001A8E3C6D|nr:hypothetical protein [Psychroflexus sp. ALD_RP9]QSS98094.1 hypothetical protein IMZ30_05100 [Psychroflexus sp. ALD_RP9]
MFKKASFKLIFDILFYMVILDTASTLIISLISLFSTNNVTEPFVDYPIFFTSNLVFSVVFVFVAFHLRKVAQLFIVNGEFKSLSLVKHLKRCGQCLVVLGLSLMAKYLTSPNIIEIASEKVDASNSVLNLLIIVIGLSFIRLSKMLKLSIEAKQAQDLTI